MSVTVPREVLTLALVTETLANNPLCPSIRIGSSLGTPQTPTPKGAVITGVWHACDVIGTGYVIVSVVVDSDELLTRLPETRTPAPGTRFAVCA